MISKTLHLYWGRNKKISYMKYLTALSFSRLNPDWKIKVHYPKVTSMGDSWDSVEQKSYDYQGIDYFELLTDIDNVELNEVDFSIYDLPINISEVHKSDIFRLCILADEGGIWSDFDIFYIKPISSYLTNLSGSQTHICNHFGYHSIGFLASSKNNKFFKQLFDYSLQLINQENCSYQIIGRDLYSAFFQYNLTNVEKFNKEYNTNIYNIPFTVVYPFQWNQIDKIFGKENYQLPENTVGIHWFAGSNSTSNYENIIIKENIHEWSDKYLLGLMSKFIDNCN